MEVPLLLWQRTDKNGNVHTELGIEIKPGDVRKFPVDLWGESGPVGDKLQSLLANARHPELVAKQPERQPKAQTPGPAKARVLPPDVDVFDPVEDNP